MLRLIFFYGSLFYFSISNVFLQDLKIKIFSKTDINKVLFHNSNGSYSIYGDSSYLLSLNADQSIEIYKSDNKLTIDFNNVNIGSFDKIRVIQDSLNSSINISVFNKKELSKRIYKGDFELDIDNDHLKIINKIDMHNYLSGVMLSEVGERRDSEYYKVQVLISRTYALKNMKRHIKNGFNLCDQVHCQAYYKSNTSFKNNIDAAVYATKDLVIVDSSNNLIGSFFHANCGGQTVEPDQVWNDKIYYLKSFKDTFCTKTKQANWEIKILKNEWLAYFKRNYFLPVNDSIMKTMILNFKQPYRKTFFIDPKYGIPLRDIRKDFSLKSTYFSCYENNDYVHLKGRGFGHGVGLCQEGAIEMVKNNYKYSEVIRYYYPGTTIINRQKID
ncbi:MAG: hypothetical protein CL824_05130 [Crocinitomicaceae bacterium]|nr:hypothetical protein [Crocinitomicaceae bacterium]